MNDSAKSNVKQMGFSPLSPLVFIAVCCFYYFNLLPVLDFSDVGWHIAAGDQILENGLPETDIWAFTSKNIVWYNISWAFDSALSYLNKYLGLSGLFLINCFVLSAIVALVYQICAWRGVSQESALIATFLVALCLLQYSALRPQLFTLLFSIIIYQSLHSNSNKNNKFLWIIPVIFITWANIHGGFLVGFVLLGTYALQALINEDKKQLKQLIIISLLSFLAVLINPYGWEIFIAVYNTLGSDFSKYITEWWPPRVFETISLSLIVSVFILVSSVRAKYVPLADKILAFFWLCMAFNSSRNFAIFAVLAAPYISLSINSFKHEENLWLKDAVLQKKNKLFSLGILTLFIALIFSFNNLKQNDKNESEIKIMSDYLSSEYKGIKLFNIYGAGGELIYYGKGSYKIFIDGRAGTAYPDHLMQDYQMIVNVASGWKELVEQYDVEAFMLVENHILSYALKLDPDWKISYKTQSGGVIFIRVDKLKPLTPPTVPFG